MKEKRSDRKTIRKSVISVTVTEEEKAIIDENAIKMGLTTSAYCRIILLSQGKNKKLI